VRAIRQLHLYLGCVFAPLLVFYAVTGALQCFNYHVTLKNGYKPPLWIQEMSRVHMDAKVVQPSARQPGYFRYYVLAMSAGLVMTTILGVILAFKVTRSAWRVWACLTMGLVLPVLLNYG